MSGTRHDAFMTVPQVAEELGMTRDGVYKLIRRGKLKAIRRSERQIYVSRLALTAYRRRLDGGEPAATRPPSDASPVQLRESFERETGQTPEEWLADWKADRIDDTPNSARLAVRALALRAYAGDHPGARPASWSAAVARAAE